ncbi:MAG TPA: type III-B CRISPR module RAMP protein Cmr1 [Bryobacteraceae bacterium]|nr:type III-B CRISPR module RAMP protein Cmr1 [Bryobacteraceae bacterium]HPQ15416.1 type III-B CRISPR module RAMP protein Cmr1 [Bryobacteraceae bacterium]
MDLNLTPLTPIWTGDADGISGSLRITGLMGSLRWWFEGIVRALGRYACDPTEEACQYDPNPKKNPLHGLCPACWLFGATGWARRFRLTGSGLHASEWCIVAAPEVARLHENWLRRVYKLPGSKVLWGDALTLQFTRHLLGAEAPGGVELGSVFCGLLNAVARFGALAAKPQNGWGVIDWRGMPQFDRKALSRFISAFPEDGRETDGMFNVSETAFLSFEISNVGAYARAARIPSSASPDYLSRVMPIAYDIRYKSSTRNFRTGAGRDRGIRPALKNLLGQRAEEIVGTSARSSQRSASRVFVSHLYRRMPQEPCRLRCWVHVPPGLERQRLAITSAIQNVVNEMFPGSDGKLCGWSDFQKEVL